MLIFVITKTDIFILNQQDRHDTIVIVT